MVSVCFRSWCNFFIIKPPTSVVFFLTSTDVRSCKIRKSSSCYRFLPGPVLVVPERSNNLIWQMGREAKRCSSSTRQSAWEQGLDLLKLKFSFSFSYPFLVRSNALEPLCSLLKKIGLVLLVEQQGTTKNILICCLMDFYLGAFDFV